MRQHGGVAVVKVEVDDERLADYRDLTDVALRSRHEPDAGLFIAESEKVARRAVAAGCRPRSFLVLERFLPQLDDLLTTVGAGEHGDVDVFVGDAATLEAITGFHVHRGVLAAMHRPPLPDVDALVAGATRIAILEDIVDHTNVGAIFRSAAAMGVDAVLVTPRCADPLYRRSVRVSMGAVFDVPWTRLASWPGGLGELRDAGFTLAALALSEDSVTLDDFAAQAPKRLALVLGAEGDGIGTATLEAMDAVVRIPMAGGIDSLNVAAAAAVAMWALRPTE